MTTPQKLTPSDLVRRIRRHNAGWCAFGIVLLGISVVFWAITIYWSTVFISVVLLPRFELMEKMEEIVSIVFLCGIAGIVLLNPALFFAVRFETDFPVIRKVAVLEIMPPNPITFLPMTLCIAPVLTVLGIVTFRQNLSCNQKQITLACTFYAYLNDYRDWIPYPPFESQRQALILLYRLGLIRISRRFGILQVKIVGEIPALISSTPLKYFEKKQ